MARWTPTRPWRGGVEEEDREEEDREDKEERRRKNERKLERYIYNDITGI